MYIIGRFEIKSIIRIKMQNKSSILIIPFESIDILFILSLFKYLLIFQVNLIV